MEANHAMRVNSVELKLRNLGVDVGKAWLPSDSSLSIIEQLLSKLLDLSRKLPDFDLEYPDAADFHDNAQGFAESMRKAREIIKALS